MLNIESWLPLWSRAVLERFACRAAAPAAKRGKTAI